ncbi:MAG: hypothetical protein ABWX69_04435 [Arthrobacter sp.]
MAERYPRVRAVIQSGGGPWMHPCPSNRSRNSCQVRIGDATIGITEAPASRDQIQNAAKTRKLTPLVGLPAA